MRSKSYDEWQTLLAGAFFQPHDGPTLFFVDDDELARLAPDLEVPAEDLARAVRARMRLDDGRNMFNPVTLQLRMWSAGLKGGPPPVLPVLALTVLAGTRMRSDVDARSTNYYLRLAQSLMPRATESETQQLRRQLAENEAFVPTVSMWRVLHAWIESRAGEVGTSTIRDHPHLLRIGYPLSQALVRQSDRAALTRLFHALEVTATSVPDREALLRALDIWTSMPGNRLAESLMRSLAEPEMRPLVGAVVEALAYAWDGVVLTQDGRQRIAIRLLADLDEWQLSWVYVRPDLPTGAISLAGPAGEEVHLREPNRGRFYECTKSLPVAPDSVVSGLRLRGSEFGAEFPAAQALFFQLDPEVGGWVSTAGMMPYEEQLVAITSGHATAFREALEAAAEPGWRAIPQRRGALLPGFALYEGVRFADATGFQAALERLPGLVKIGVAPTAVPRARFVRGLPLADHLAAAHYLRGGEPDLLLPSGPDAKLMLVTLDGIREELWANGFPLELRRFITRAGRHAVDVDGRGLEFTTLDEGPEDAMPAGTGSIAWRSDVNIGEPGVGVGVSGALAPTAPESPTAMIRRDREESWLLSEPGRVVKLSIPPAPRFLESIDVALHSQYFEMPVAAQDRWVAQRRRDQWFLTGIGAGPSLPLKVEFDVLSTWRRTASDSNGAKLWDLQVGLAAAERAR